jgi:hypothetical protein
MGILEGARIAFARANLPFAVKERNIPAAFSLLQQ